MAKNTELEILKLHASPNPDNFTGKVYQILKEISTKTLYFSEMYGGGTLSPSPMTPVLPFYQSEARN